MVCLGDVIGYGPDPVECIDLVREHCEWSLLGNHDFAALYEPTNFNAAARDAVFWTRGETLEQGWMKRQFAIARGLAIPSQRSSAAKSAAAAPCMVGSYRYELTEGGKVIVRSHLAGARFDGPTSVPLSEPADALVPLDAESFSIRYLSGESEVVHGADDAARFNTWAAAPRRTPKPQFDLKVHRDDPLWQELLAAQRPRVDFMFSISPRQILLDRYICVHASPSRPVNEYLFPEDVAQGERKLRRNFGALTLPDASGNSRRVSALVGHTHCPGFLLEERDEIESRLREAAAVVPTYRMSAEAIQMHQGLNCVASASDREAIAFLILTGQFIGFLPDHYAAAWVAQGQMAASTAARQLLASMSNSDKTTVSGSEP
jgi:hypothetical protein